MARHWTPERLELLRKFYADWPSAWLAPHFSCSRQGLDTKASQLGLRKRHQFINPAENTGCFRKGTVPPNKREERRLTAATERATGQFHCSSSAHFAAGTPVIIRGRKVCQACAAKRRKRLAALSQG